MNFYNIVYGPTDGPFLILNVGSEENLAAIYAEKEEQNQKITQRPQGKLIIKEAGKVVVVLQWRLVQGIVDIPENQRRLDIVQGPQPEVSQIVKANFGIQN